MTPSSALPDDDNNNNSPTSLNLSLQRRPDDPLLLRRRGQQLPPLTALVSPDNVMMATSSPSLPRKMAVFILSFSFL